MESNAISVEYIDSMGNDLMVANVARVSFAKESKEFTFREDKPEGGSDEGIIDYLARENHWCYDDKTEIFTQKGWVNFKDLDSEDLVSEVCWVDGGDFSFKFTRPIKIHKTHYKGVMYSCNTPTISYSVTPHHKMVYKGRTSRGHNDFWSVGNSDELYGKYKVIPTKCSFECEGIVESVDRGRLIGFLLGDGFKSNKNVNSPLVRVRLKKSRKILYLEELLNRLDIKYTKSTCSRGVTEFGVKYDIKLYRDGHKYFSVEEALSRGGDFCSGLLDGLLNSDGSKKRKTWSFSTSSTYLRDLFCSVATMCGENPVEGKSTNFSNPKHNECFNIMLQTRSQSTVNKFPSRGDEGVVEYEGMVSCVTVPSGWVLVRRNGRQMICGNTPFGHPQVQFRVKAPVPIRTQCFKSKVGFVENEESRRYISTKPELFIPESFRSRPSGSIKQGSGGVHPDSELWLNKYVDTCNNSLEVYLTMVEGGVSPEQARFILPQGCMVNWVWTGSLAAYARFCNLRKDSHAQEEVKVVADQIDRIIQDLFPVCWKYLIKG